MNAIRKRDPFQEMTDLRQSMDRMFDQFFWAPRSYWRSEMDVSLDVAESPDEFIVKASLPGIKPEDIDITFTERTLTIKGEVKGDEETKDARYYLRERWSGSFARSVQLPAQVQPAPELKRIFRKFARGSAAAAHGVKGTGIGLAMVKHIVDAHAGRVVVDSEPGRGSTFTIILPVGD